MCRVAQPSRTLSCHSRVALSHCRIRGARVPVGPGRVCQIAVRIRASSIRVIVRRPFAAYPEPVSMAHTLAETSRLRGMQCPVRTAQRSRLVRRWGSSNVRHAFPRPRCRVHRGERGVPIAGVELGEHLFPAPVGGTGVDQADRSGLRPHGDCDGEVPHRRSLPYARCPLSLVEPAMKRARSGSV